MSRTTAMTTIALTTIVVAGALMITAASWVAVGLLLVTGIVFMILIGASTV